MCPSLTSAVTLWAIYMNSLVTLWFRCVHPLGLGINIQFPVAFCTKYWNLEEETNLNVYSWHLTFCEPRTADWAVEIPCNMHWAVLMSGTCRTEAWRFAPWAGFSCAERLTDIFTGLGTTVECTCSGLTFLLLLRRTGAFNPAARTHPLRWVELWIGQGLSPNQSYNRLHRVMNHSAYSSPSV